MYSGYLEGKQAPWVSVAKEGRQPLAAKSSAIAVREMGTSVL